MILDKNSLLELCSGRPFFLIHHRLRRRSPFPNGEGLGG